MLRYDIPTGHVIYNIHTYLLDTYYNIPITTAAEEIP
jgi:hypothetical protein